MLINYLFLMSTFHSSMGLYKRMTVNTVIGGIFDEDTSFRAFSLAIRTMNECNYVRRNCDILNDCPAGVDCNDFHNLHIAAVSTEVTDDLLDTLKKVNEVADTGAQNDWVENKFGLAALIGPHHEQNSKLVQGWCEMNDLPNIVIRPELNHDSFRTINLYPDTRTLSTIYVEMLTKLNWTSFSILYEESDNFLALDDVLKSYGPWGYPVYAFYLGKGPNFSEPLLLAKQKTHKNIIIDCSYKHLAEILKQIQEVGMMTESYRYIITSLNLQSVDLRAYQYSGVNITGLGLVDPNDPFVNEFVGAHLADFDIPSVEKLTVEEALMFDAVVLFAQAYKDLTYNNEITEGAKPPKILLTDEKQEDYWQSQTKDSAAWTDGLSLRNYIMFNTINGLTGPVTLDSDGARRRFKLNILSLHENGLTKVGTRDPEDGFDDLRLMNELTTTHFKVLITLTEPYAMRVNYSKSLEGNERYEGFVIDIIKELSKILNFNYTFYVQDPPNNGMCSKSVHGKCTCNGMMEKILNREMDMAITDLTVTEDREHCVDFSTGFWNLGMGVLYKKPSKAPTTLFSFLSPFHKTVWIYLGGIYILVSVLFFILGRLSPAEWCNPLPCIEEPVELHNQFTLGNSFWFTMGAIMQQGSEIAPISTGTRILAGSWFFFCLIIVSSYTANLAAFLTIESPIKVIRGIDDLYNQTKIKYGFKANGSTYQYFKSSGNKKYKSLADQLDHKDWRKYLVVDNKDGINLVKEDNENFAFIMESSSIDYIENRECGLQMAGDIIDQKSYAIAYKDNFEYHHQISRSISILQEKLVIKDLYDKWWHQKGRQCFESTSSNAEPMNLGQLSGVFCVLSFGIFLSCLLTSWEFCLGIKASSKKEKVKLVTTLKEEVKFISKGKAVKPVFKRNRSTDSNEMNVSDDYSCNYTMTTQA